MGQTYRLLVINPGSTSTKIAVFDNEEVVFEGTLRHSTEELTTYEKVTDQYEFRMNIVLEALNKNDIDINTFSAIIGRGGLLKPIEGGTYKVNERMLEDLKSVEKGEHASDLGGFLAHGIAQRIGAEAYIVDPVVVDELTDVARISGLKEIERASIFHALNHKAVARRHAKLQEKKYEDMNLIVAHLGGGISVGAHQNGKVIDVPNALNGQGPFSPERTGALPVGDLIKLCYCGKFTYEEMKKKISGKGGLVSYLNTNSALEVKEMIDNGDEYAKLIYYAMAYQVSKEIGSCAAVLKGKVDGILLTGGIAHDKMFTDWISESISFISDVYIYPGEDELTALAEGGLRVLRGEEEAKEYI
ncbi:butyrate kinase [Schnuerera sp. xch1]|uniref:butyrate kinase n=1 Tax=Schnuerera sp. xch1 TaxID=2874283 RepID=UPI001CBE81EC|nr:butyrate kinase [Schnuerera sp. xch1]MBZ2175964.1 butyrate kinase [Schnuerera sp. xch1]